MTTAETLGDRVAYVLDAAAAEGIPVGPAEQQRVLMLMSRLVAARREPRDGPALGRVLAPLLARGPHEQGRLQASAEAAFTEQSSPPEPPAPSLVPEGERRPLVRSTRWSSVLISLAAAGLLALLAWLAWRHWQISYQEPVTPPPQQHGGSTGLFYWMPPPPSLPVPDWPWDRTWRWYVSEYDASKWLGLLLPWVLLALALWPLWRSLGAYLRRQDALQRFGEERMRLRAAAAPLLDQRRLAWTVQRMRRMPASTQTELAVEASVRATTAAAGRPVLVMSSRTVSIPYVALLERVGARDHQAELFALMLRAMQDAGLHVEVWEFAEDPRFLRGPGGRSAALDELMRGHPDRRLLLLADGNCLIDPVTGAPASWTTALLGAGARMLLTPRPAAEWGALERVLVEQLGFRVEEATPEGIARLAAPVGATRVRAGNTGPPRTLFALLASRPLLWTAAVRPAPSSVRALLSALSRGLDAACLGWLRALAVYPELRWPLTLHLGAQLAPAGESGEAARRALSLVRLPWLRIGTIPDWLRRELLAGMSRAEETAVRGFFRDGGGRGGVRIDLDVLRPSAGSPRRVPRDGVFLDFVYSLRRVRGMPVRLFRRLASLLRLRKARRFLAAAAAGCVLASCLSVLSLSLLPLDPCDALGANVWDPDRVGAGVEPLALVLRPGVVEACRVAAARGPNNGRWKYQLGAALRYARREPAPAPVSETDREAELDQVSGTGRKTKLDQVSGTGRKTKLDPVSEARGGPTADLISKSARLGYPIAEQDCAYRSFEDGDKVGGHEHLERLRGLNIALTLETEGVIAREGWEGPADQDKALQKFEASIDAGNNDVWSHAYILETRGEWQRFFALLQRGVTLGDPGAFNEVGFWSKYGKREGENELVTVDLGRAMRLYAAAAAAGDAAGLHNLAINLWHSSGNRADNRRACDLMFQSAYLGNLAAIVQLAKMLTEKGSDCHIEGLAPRALYERAADKGDVNALLAMADAYGKGDLGLPPDAGKASEYYRRVIASEEARDAQKAEARKKIEELEKQP